MVRSGSVLNKSSVPIFLAHFENPPGECCRRPTSPFPWGPELPRGSGLQWEARPRTWTERGHRADGRRLLAESSAHLVPATSAFSRAGCTVNTCSSFQRPRPAACKEPEAGLRAPPCAALGTAQGVLRHAASSLTLPTARDNYTKKMITLRLGATTSLGASEREDSVL